MRQPVIDARADNSLPFDLSNHHSLCPRSASLQVLQPSFSLAGILIIYDF